MKPRKRRKASPVAILVVGTALTASFLARGGSSSSVDEATGTGPMADGMLTEWGFRDVVTAVKARTGDTEVLDLTLYPTYAELVTVAVREAETRLAEPAGTYVEVVPGRRGPMLRTVAGDGRDGLVVLESTADGRVRSVTGP